MMEPGSESRKQVKNTNKSNYYFKCIIFKMKVTVKTLSAGNPLEFNISRVFLYLV